MRIPRARLGAILLVAAASHPTIASGPREGSGLAASLRGAAEALESSTPAGDPAKPLTEIVGVLSQAADRSGLPADARDRIRAAHAALQKDGWSAEPGARKALNEVYASINGRAFRFPPGVVTIDEVRKAYRSELDRAVAALEKESPAEAVKPVLELLMLVSTPMAAN
jgi:hypothetical protein